MSRPTGTADELERRRKRAVQAVAEGEARKTVAKVLGVHYKTVARWVREDRQHVLRAAVGGTYRGPDRGREADR